MSEAFDLAEALSALAIHECDEAAFKPIGLWDSFDYRDLGMAEATGGKVGAIHLRAKGPCQRDLGFHRHELDFQMVYILKGWVTYRWQGHAEPITAHAGASVYSPPGEVHNVIDYSEDMEVIEVTMPAD
ncbi:MAG: cupin domain-containing protein, partial [Defluviicoccus sp.]|nr:cupin domain-containing protein [Defluviicoccus sp.]